MAIWWVYIEAYRQGLVESDEKPVSIEQAVSASYELVCYLDWPLDPGGAAASRSDSRQHVLKADSNIEDDMENAVEATTILFNVMGGLGLFFTGIGALWFVTVYKDKKE